MATAEPLRMSNKKVEDRAIEHVLAFERLQGRSPRDTRRGGVSPVDVESFDPATGRTWLIEVKAFGASGRGDDMWLETKQVEALEGNDDGHVYIVTHVRSVNPSDIQLLDLTGVALQQCLRAKRPKAHFEIPLPTALYDRLRAEVSPAGGDSPIGAGGGDS